MNTQRIRVLVVDDSTVVRRIVAKVLGDDPRIEVVGTAVNGKVALEKVDALRPDVVTLDLDMPVMGGLETLAELRRRSPDLPVIVFSAADEAGAVGALTALQAGASDYMTKSSQLARITDAAGALQEELIPKILAIHAKGRRTQSRSALARSEPRTPLASTATRPILTEAGSAPEIIAIGASTGGPKALQGILPDLPKSFPVPIVIVQHMPAAFTATLARSLDQRCQIRVQEAYEGAEIWPGEAWIAPGDYHMTVERTAGGGRLHLDQGPKENSCRPSLDPLFRSVAKNFRARSLAIVLTGMGSDGLDGARALAQIGARIVVQDEASSVVWGMPGAIANAKLAAHVLGQQEFASFLERSVAARAPRGAGVTR